MKRISIVSPAFNEEENVEPMYAELKQVFQAELSEYELELVFVNDGSLDGTAERVKALADKDARVRLVSLTRNFGHQAALAAGLERATGDAIVTMDCDLQHPPAAVPRLVRSWEEGHRVVYARRSGQENTLFKRLTSQLYYKLIDGTADVAMPRDVGDFRLIDRVVQRELLRLREHAVYLRGLVPWLGFESDTVDYVESARLHGGQTRYTLKKMFGLAMAGMLNFSFLPLRIGLWLGVFSIVMAGIFFAYVAYQHFVAGVFYQLYKWMIVLIFGFIGLQFIMIWILGEYIGRIYADVKRRPLFVIGEEYGGRQEETLDEHHAAEAADDG